MRRLVGVWKSLLIIGVANNRSADNQIFSVFSVFSSAEIGETTRSQFDT